jgi:hypothetical protein
MDYVAQPGKPASPPPARISITFSSCGLFTVLQDDA